MRRVWKGREMDRRESTKFDGKSKRARGQGDAGVTLLFGERMGWALFKEATKDF